MAATEDRLHGVEALEELYRDSPEVDEPHRESLDDWCRRLLIGWLAVFGSILLFEPAPSDPNAVVPLWGNVLVTVFIAAFVAGIIGLSLRRSWALPVSLVAGGLGLAVGAACAVTDHHAGFWAAYEIVAFFGLAVVSWIAMRTTE